MPSHCGNWTLRCPKYEKCRRCFYLSGTNFHPSLPAYSSAGDGGRGRRQHEWSGGWASGDQRDCGGSGGACSTLNSPTLFNSEIPSPSLPPKPGFLDSLKTRHIELLRQDNANNIAFSHKLWVTCSCDRIHARERGSASDRH